MDPKRVGWSAYIGMSNNPLSLTDPDGGSPEGWIRDSQGRYLWDENAVDQSTTPDGWTFIGCQLPDDVNPNGLDILIKINGSLYYKNTTNLPAKLANLLGAKEVEHKPYDPIEERMLGDIIANGAGTATVSTLFKILKGSSYAREVLRNAKNVNLTKAEQEILNVIKSEGDKLDDLIKLQEQYHRGMIEGVPKMKELYYKAGEEIAKQRSYVQGLFDDFVKTVDVLK